jgi:phage-related protein
MSSLDDKKEIRWIGSAYDDLLAFPQAPRKEAGFQLGKVQAQWHLLKVVYFVTPGADPGSMGTNVAIDCGFRLSPE